MTISNKQQDKSLVTRFKTRSTWTRVKLLRPVDSPVDSYNGFDSVLHTRKRNLHTKFYNQGKSPILGKNILSHHEQVEMEFTRKSQKENGKLHQILQFGRMDNCETRIKAQ